MPPANWTILPNPTLPGDPPTSPSYAALHPARGIALVDVAPFSTPNAVTRLRAGLAMIGFDRTFPGHLPIIQVQVAAFDCMTLTAYLETVFAAEASITLATDPETQKWPAQALRVLGNADLASLPAFMPAPVPFHAAGPDAQPRQSTLRPTAQGRAKFAVAAGAGLLAAAAGGGMLAYTSGVGPDARRPPAPAAATVAGLDQTPPTKAPSGASMPETPAVAPVVMAPSPASAPPTETQPDPPLPEPAPTSTASDPAVAAPSASPSASRPAPKPGQISAATAISRARDYMAQHDISAARTWYEWAFEAGDGTAAVSLGLTYDADFLALSGDRLPADATKVQEWFDKARASGDPRVEGMLRLTAAARRHD